MRIMLVSGGGFQYLAGVIPAMERLGAVYKNLSLDPLTQPAPNWVPRAFRRYYVDEKSLAAYRAEIEAFRPDVVHVTGLRHFLIRMIKALKPYPSIALAYERISTGGISVLSPLDPYLFNHPRLDRFVVPSKATINNWMGGRYTRGLVRRDRIEPMHYAFELPAPTSAEEKRALRERLGLDPDAFIVGTVAYVRPWKNVEFTAEAVRGAKTDRPIMMAVVGGSGANPAYEAKVRAAGGDRLKMLGIIPQAHRIMPAFDLYVTPTALPGESFGMSFAEAMAHGVPAITMNYGASAEICEHGFTGYALPESVPVWRRHIEELANDPEKLARMGQAARLRIAERFSPEVRALDYWRMYSTAIEERRSGR